MNIAQGADTFRDLFPDMMKATRLLIIDHDVTRYHSFDLLRYTLFTREDLFGTLKPEYYQLIVPHQEVADQVQFMRTNVPVFNIFEMFNKDEDARTPSVYVSKIREMFADKHAKITPTDISTRFDIVFDNPSITGYLLQYKGENHHPSCYRKMTVYESENLLDLNMAVKIIQKHSINAVMICSNEMALRLVISLARSGYTTPITFIIGRYAYNFHMNENRCVLPTYNSEIGIAEIQYKHEFGFFDPFSGLTYRFRFKHQTDNKE